MTSGPAVLFYCQHAVGMGHLVRSLALAGALARRFRVVFLSGGRVPHRLPFHRASSCVHCHPWPWTPKTD